MKKLIIIIWLLIFGASSFASELSGRLAPDFKLMAQDGSYKSLSNYKGKWLVLYFYPKDGTPGCTTEAKNFRDNIGKFKALQAEVVGISLDDNESHQEFSKQYQLPFDILSDTDKSVAKDYKVLGGFGPIEYTKRETFIIDPLGNIVYHYKKVDAAKHAKQVLAKLKQLQKDLGKFL